jgi:hypothetical protein
MDAHEDPEADTMMVKPRRRLRKVADMEVRFPAVSTRHGQFRNGREGSRAFAGHQTRTPRFDKRAKW